MRRLSTQIGAAVITVTHTLLVNFTVAAREHGKSDCSKEIPFFV